MRMAVVMSREELNALGYPVVVEGWHHAVGNGAAGRQRRAFHAEFSEAERVKARKIYNTFYRWYLKTGTPDRLVIMSNAEENHWTDELPIDPAPVMWGKPNNTFTWTLATFQLAKRLIQFFGTI